MRTASQLSSLNNPTSLALATFVGLLLAGCGGNPNASLDQASGNNPDTNSVPSQGAANPTPVPPTTSGSVSCGADDASMRSRMLELINSARAQSRSCGGQSFSATSPLSWNDRLTIAAKNHSNDMSQHNFFSHTGSDGSSVSNRVSSAGYEWRAVGENIAAGQRTAEETVNGWLGSPGHCRNLMNPAYTEVSVACSADSGADYNRYWTNVLATPL